MVTPGKIVSVAVHCRTGIILFK
uniref:Uncharacterized protein n=1 Tax=Anguilla anguilla TaxID=7936 RepID=A0A0E9UV21_ANGAN